jgi:hypothetical protein
MQRSAVGVEPVAPTSDVSDSRLRESAGARAMRTYETIYEHLRSYANVRDDMRSCAQCLVRRGSARILAWSSKAG